MEFHGFFSTLQLVSVLDPSLLLEWLAEPGGDHAPQSWESCFLNLLVLHLFVAAALHLTLI